MSGNSTGGSIKVDGANLYLYIKDFTSSDATKLTLPAASGYPSARVYSFDEGGTPGNHNITFVNGVVSCTSTGAQNGYAWKFLPNSNVSELYPLEIPILVYPTIDLATDILLNTKLSNSAMTGRFLCRG
jgi:hypothetical protein